MTSDDNFVPADSVRKAALPGSLAVKLAKMNQNYKDKEGLTLAFNG